MSSSIDKAVSDGSDLCILEEQEVPYIKKTVRFSEKIRQQLFRFAMTFTELGLKKAGLYKHVNFN